MFELFRNIYSLKSETYKRTNEIESSIFDTNDRFTRI